MTRFMRAVLVVCLLASLQAATPTGVLRGELRDLSGSADRLTVVVSNGSGPSETAFVGPTGSFQFHSLALGTYQLEIRNMQGDVIKQQMVSLTGPAMDVTISLGTYSKAAGWVPPGEATVSVKRLRHDPNGKAEQEYLAGSELLVKKDLVGARKHLAKALRADPDFAEAHLELGTAHFRMGAVEEARREFQRAVELDPKLGLAWGNLATLLFQAKSYDEAEAAARHGLETAPYDAKLHFVAGASLLAKGKFGQDATDHLEEASKGYPNAHLLLAEALLRLGQAKNVLMDLEAALVSSNQEVRNRAEYLIERLKTK